MFSLAIFGGNKVDGSMLHPGESVFGLALFGGLDFDFTTASPPPDVELTIVTIFGGATVKVLPDERVSLSGFSLFGGRSVEPRRPQSSLARPRPEERPRDGDDENALPLDIIAYALFGGVAVKRATF